MSLAAKSSTDQPIKSTLSGALGAKLAGLRTCVPILGSGLNLQAAKLEGSHEDDWDGLLARIARELSLSPSSLDRLPRPHLFRWESMLRLWARVKHVEPFQAEVELQKLTCDYLRSLEANAAHRGLYLEFSSARFADVLSLNFDRRMALSFPTLHFKGGPNPCPEGSHGETLYRHDLLEHTGGIRTRIWYPHGDTKKPSTLKLGVRKYGFYVGTIEESQSGRGEDWRFKRAWNQWEKLPVSNPQTPKWTEVFLNRTLMFIGCGLSFDEWPLWSMLRRRAAQPARRRRPAYFVTASPLPREHTCALGDHGIAVLSFSSYEHMWDAIRPAIV